MNRKILLILLFLLSTLTACAPLVGTLQVGVETPLSSKPETMEPDTLLLTPEVVVTEEPVSVAQNGTVNGRVCYPSEFIPAMTAYFQHLPTGSLTEIAVAENQSNYSVELAPGAYHAFAWVEDYQLGGAFTAYVACGYGEACTDHALQTFEVQAGQETPNIDLCDWPLLAEHLPVPFPTSETDPMLAGMIYSTMENTYFQVGSNGLETEIHGGLGMVISPDGTYGLYLQVNDLFVINLKTGEQFNLTNTPDMIETLYQWPLQNQIFFAAIPQRVDSGPGMTGGLYRIQADGTGLTGIDPETNAGNFAVSPNGRFVAYGAGRTAFIYDLELSQRGIFDPANFNLSSPNGIGIASPAWSPNGQKLAWIAQGDFNGPDAFAVIAFDLSTTTFEVIHPYRVVGMDGYLPPAKFSPDGNWIAFQAFDQDNAQNGVWIASVGDPNQTTEVFLGSYTAHPLWSPDGRWVAFHQYVEGDQGQRVFLYDVYTNNILQAFPLPLNATVLDW